MHTGELYLPGGGEIIKEQFRDIDLLKNIIKLCPGSRKSVKNCLKMLGDADENCYIEAPCQSGQKTRTLG